MRFREPRLWNWLIFFVLALYAPGSFGQSGAEPGTTPKFDFASIRQNPSPQIAWRMQFVPDGVIAEDVTLQYAIEEAYNLYDSKRWSGGPEWLSVRRFNIEARFDPTEYREVTLEQRRAMLQQLLADRFKLVVHRAPREFPLYALTVGRHGPKFSASKQADTQAPNLYGSTCVITRSNLDHLEMKGCTTQQFASVLSGQARADLNRNVVDETGLSGRYDFAVYWTPDDPRTAQRLNSAGPSIFTAVQEQLGLELRPTKGPLETMVIDHVEMPSEN